MRTLKFLIATLGLATATATLAQAPPGPHGGAGFGPRFDIERLAVLLDLDPYQKQEVERVLTEQRDAARAARQAHEQSGERPTMDELRARREQARADTLGKLENVLSEQQIAKLELLLEPPAGPRGGRRGPPRSAENAE